MGEPWGTGAAVHSSHSHPALKPARKCRPHESRGSSHSRVEQ